VARARCSAALPRGIDTLTALALVTEIGGFDRFKSAEFMAFVGLVPLERSSGEQRRQGSITKVGKQPRASAFGRVGLARAARPKVGYELARRRRGQDAVVVERAGDPRP